MNEHSMPMLIAADGSVTRLQGASDGAHAPLQLPDGNREEFPANWRYVAR